MKNPAIFLLVLVCTCVNGQQDGPSPDSEFLTQPSNVTVPVGERVVLKCMVASKVHLCRWYFLELGLRFFDKRVTPMLVKEFSPSNQQDCSIKIEKVKKIQEGKWLCQAFKFMSTKFIMSKPATLRVITESESSTWEPPRDGTQLSPRNGRREDDEIANGKDFGDGIRFHTSDDDIIQDVFIHEAALLKCKVDQPLQTCSWIMPSGVNLTAPKGNAGEQNKSSPLNDYKITGKLSEGNCSLELTKVSQYDEGNWRCVVKAEGASQEVQGPLLHLHILDPNTASKHTHDDQLIVNNDEESINYLVISLVIISGMLFVIVLLLLMFLYRRLRGSNDETQRILQNSPRSSVDFQTKMISNNDLTSASVMAVEPRKKLPYDDDNQYNQYLDMTGPRGNSNDGYVMMPGSSIRSSTSSRTTLSTLSTFPIGRSRSASNSTTDSGIFPHLTTIIDNPSYIHDMAAQQRGLKRPDSVYSNDHVYEEIKEKIDEIVSKMEKIPEADSPTYVNTSEDCEGYLVPKKSPTNDQPEKQAEKTGDAPQITRTPLPDPTNTTSTDDQTKESEDENERPPPYSRVGSNGLVPVPATSPAPDPGYSKVGNETQNQPDPMESYDIPRPNPPNLLDSYDVPRQNPLPVNSQPTSPTECTVEVDGLSGIIV